MVWYLDTSAFLKLLVREESSEAMGAWFVEHQPNWSSQLLRTESHRAAARLGVAPDAVDEVLETVSLVMPGPATFRVAGRLQPDGLRSLDALHLATALELGEDLDGVVAYDARMAEGARLAGMSVVTPTA